MRVQLAQQAQEILGTSDLVIITERVDDVALLIGQMVKMGLPEVLDRHIPRHWTQRGISWGWTAVIWLASIVTEGDHRKVSMETYLQGMHHILSHLTAQVIAPLDFSDDGCCASGASGATQRHPRAQVMMNPMMVRLTVVSSHRSLVGLEPRARMGNACFRQPNARGERRATRH
jgi:hypothetical protein